MAKLLRKVLKRKKTSQKEVTTPEQTIPDTEDLEGLCNDYEDLHVYEPGDDDHVYKQLEPDDDVYNTVDLTQKKNYLLVAAIDLGTSASGYAFSFLNEYQNNPLQISTHIWTAATTVLRSSKTPTCILFNSDRQFDSFGYDAQNKYSEIMTEDAEHWNWFYFENFKMTLYDNKELTIFTEIRSQNNQTMRAITVFSECIKYLKNHLLERCANMACGLKEEDVLWTLTVPAIWNDKAKLFMRRAAERAGIPREQLFLALEPEAGAIFCKHLPIEISRTGDKEESMNSLNPGTLYMVVDAGGGTIDITIHEVLENKKIREVHAANGGPWGGSYVNGAYLDFLQELIGKDPYTAFKENYTDDFLDVIREFESKKQSVKGDGSNVIIRIPVALLSCFKEHYREQYSNLSDRIQALEEYKDRVQLKKEKLVLKEELFFSFFKPTVDKIVNHLDVLLAKEKDISTILLIGGFAESVYLQKEIRSKFCNKSVIIPSEASLSVLKGAVIFGHDRGIVSSRILKCSYGIECSHDFKPGVHDMKKMYTNSLGILKCRSIFGIIAKMGESVDLSCASNERYLLIDEPGVEIAKISIYISTIDVSPKYISDKGCRKIGYIEAPLAGDKNSIHRKIYFSLKFGDTEVKVLCRNENSTNHTEELLNLLEEETMG